MIAIRVLVSRCLDLILRRSRDARLQEEIRTHLDLLVDDYMARGMTPDEARHAARQSFGDSARTTDAYRDQRGFPALDALVLDIRFAVRLLVKDPRFTLATVAALGLGIGARGSFRRGVRHGSIRWRRCAASDAGVSRP